MTIDVDTLNEVSGVVWDGGHRLLHTHRFCESDLEQVEFLAKCYQPHGEVLDAGCGFGEVSRLMVQLGVPAKFTLLNISDYQLSKCPTHMKKVLGNAEDMPFEAGQFDGVMFNTALCNMDRMRALAEAHRVLKPDGRLFISDVVIPVNVDYDAVAMADEMHAHVSRAHDLVLAIYESGFRIEAYRLPPGCTKHMQFMGEVTDRLFTPLKPIVLKCSKH